MKTLRFFMYSAAVLLLFTVSAPCLFADDPPAEPVPITEDAAAQAWDRAVGDLRLQTEMPQEEPTLTEEDIKPVETPLWIPELARFLLFGGLALLLAMFVFKILDSWRYGPRSEKLAAEIESAPEAAPEAVVSRMREARDEAEALAARGLFGQAMHLLLLRSVSEMRLWLSISIAASLTSREIVGRVTLGQRTRAALADLVERVELSYFGDYETSESEYLACRRSFEVLTENLKAGGQA